MNVLVTGAGGFLGQYVVEQHVARGDRVRALGRGKYSALQAMAVETVRVDLRDRQATVAACQGMDLVQHTAGVAGIWGPWEHFYGINTLGTQHVLEGCQQHGVRRLVFTSSPSVTFDGGDQCNVNESAPYPSHWLCHYPHTKALAEQAVLAANGQHGLATCALRPHLIWGPRDRHLIPRLMERARGGALRRVGDGQNLVDMIYVENAAAAHLQAADALVDAQIAPAGHAYFISQGQPVNCWDWINDLLALGKLPPVTRGISAGAAWRVGSLLEMVYRLTGRQSEPRMTRFLAAQLSKSHYFDISAARRDFGYVPAISSEEGMRRLAVSIAPAV